MKKLFAVFLISLSMLSTAYAGAPTAADQADLKRVETYLNGLQHFRASILQLNPDGSVIGGALQIQRPGKLRLDYDPPAKSFIIADGTFVHYWDDQLEQTSSVPENDSPAALILKAQVDFANTGKNGMTISDITRVPGAIEITLYKTDDKDSGILTLVFEDNPLKLRQWRVKDSQGAVTRVTLHDLDATATFGRDAFTYRAPNFGANPSKPNAQ